MLSKPLAFEFSVEVPTLLQHHLDQLRASIDIPVIRERGYWSATEWQQLDGRPLVWTEGSKKADALASRGFVAVSTPGVEGWRSPSAITDLWGLALKGRDVYCMYDSDLLLKPAVRRAALALAKWMETKGAVVYVLDWQQLSELAA